MRRELLTETPSPQALQRSISHVGLVLLLFTRFQYSCSAQDRDATIVGRGDFRGGRPSTRPADLRTAPAPNILYVTSRHVLNVVSNVMQSWIQTGYRQWARPSSPRVFILNAAECEGLACETILCPGMASKYLFSTIMKPIFIVSAWILPW